MKLTKAVRYRLEQFLRALTAQRTISKRRAERATKSLPPQARALFARQAPPDQRHALAVYETLLAEGHTNEDLLAAALLHDVGKAAVQASPWQRGMFVLWERFLPASLHPGMSEAAGRADDSEGRERRLATYANHPEIGARWAAEVGCSALTVELIRHHERPVETCHTARDRLLAALQAADNVN